MGRERVMQEPTIFAPLYPAGKQGTTASLRNRLFLVLLPVLTVVLVGGGIFWLQWASQRGIALGYPMPQVHMTSSATGTIRTNDSVSFSANSGGRDISYVWDFGDHSANTGANVTHAYQQFGNYTVTVTVTDPIGQTSTDTTRLNVLPQPPHASFTYSVQSSYYSYAYVTFDASASTVDTGTSISSYSWNFGDGSTDTSSYSQDTHSYSGSGTYTVTLTVTDGTGQTSQAASMSFTL